MDIEIIKEINEKIMDEESKKIFASRVLYSITGDKAHLYNLGNEFKDSVMKGSAWKSFVDVLKGNESTRGLMLYGAGVYGEKMIHMTQKIKWKGIIDKQPRRDHLRNIPIESVSNYLSRGGNESIVIPSKRYFEEMRDILIEQGVDKERILDGTLLYDLTEGKQYFDLEALPHTEGKEVFLDVGCCDGMTSIQFLNWCHGNGFCYCFEPDEKNIGDMKANMTSKNISANDYCLIPKGIWNIDGQLSFVATGNGSSHVAGVYGGKNYLDAETIEVTTIDHAIGDSPVTFIKMDIEGAELKALQGAEKLICAYKPKLAICVYHKREDIQEIPEYILQLRPDYRLYLRHYSFGESETVLYAV